MTPSTNIISIINQKGGTGKTTTTTNLAKALQKKGYKILTIDADPQACLSFHFGIQNVESRNLTQLIKGECSIQEIIQEKEGIDIIPSNISLAETDMFLHHTKDRAYIIKELISEIAFNYDFILIDCAPSLSFLTINMLSASNGVLIPLQLEVLSLQGLSLIIDTVFQVKESYNSSLSILGILPVMVDYRRNITSEILDYLQNHFGIRIFKNRVPVDVRAVEAPSFGQSVIEYAPNSTSSLAYQAFAKELLKLQTDNSILASN
ncbi:ParA family protein [Sediminitomix flava]|uniref:Chromosome partitioning protein n=1 Tax=Sediminitomix flava TaxID=379075 RepID=A0A315Z788_SEDFL|nr:ParA family protein [Sediminitomix flava]PWJ39401.1 chromosome partitioning protein [Sediminitomix flava]